jgi:hypothetical protein
MHDQANGGPYTMVRCFNRPKLCAHQAGTYAPPLARSAHNRAAETPRAVLEADPPASGRPPALGGYRPCHIHHPTTQRDVDRIAAKEIGTSYAEE